MTGAWEPGAVVVRRYVWHGRVQVAVPSRVVQDDGARVALYTASGTRGMHTRGTPDEILRTLWEPEWELFERRYEKEGTHVLHLLEEGKPFEVRLMTDDDGRVLYWQGNLQEPFRRTRVGFDTRDHVADLISEDDVRTWRWKDWDDLIVAHEHGVFSAGEVEAIRSAGEELVARAASGSYPFDGTWASWRPDPAWSVPGLPPGWDD